MDINSIESPEFLQDLKKNELKVLCKDIRTFLIENISKTGGHLASNLGVVELTVGLHYVFNKENDKLIFDVGHQAYTHKILTGRAKKFNTLRKTNGLSGFVNYDESKYDCWESGHSSTSISAMSGFLLAKKNGEDIGDVVSIIGDSSVANGMAFEALNFVSTIEGVRPIVILNDNKMGISKSVGATARLFNAMGSTRFYRGLKRLLIKVNPRFVVKWFHQIKQAIKAFVQLDNIFEDMGFDYYGPYDGNDIDCVIRVLERAKASKKPCLIHFITKKGLGYDKAEQDEKGSFHGIGPFDVETGKSLKVFSPNEYSYSEVIARGLMEYRKDNNFTLINPATMVGNRLIKFQQQYPNSIYDVGIAEEHAMSMAGAMALCNEKVAVLMYSTFFQRAYDQFLNDIARRNLHVVVGLDRAGLVSSEGSTHQGIYDIAMCSSMPNVKICMGSNLAEAKALIKYAFSLTGPVIVRYPKRVEFYTEDIKINDTKWCILNEGTKGYVISYGYDALRLLNIVKSNNLDFTVINARFIRPLDEEMLESIYQSGRNIYVIEQVVNDGSLGQMILNNMISKNYHSKIKLMNIPTDSYVDVGSVDDLLKKFNLDDESIYQELIKSEN